MREEAAAVEAPAGVGGSGLVWLSLAAGSTDALSFLALRNLFTSAMTGNTALLAVAIGRGEWTAASRALCALAAFSLGVAIGAVLEAAWRGGAARTRTFHWLVRLELAILVVGAALWSTGPDPLRGPRLYAVITLSAASMGIQAVAALGADSRGISTIVFTTVLVRLVSRAVTGMAEPGPGSPPAPAALSSPLWTFAAYVGGAAVAAGLWPHGPGAIVWLPVAAVSLALVSSGRAPAEAAAEGRR